jgi:hypothetical protein
MWYVLNERSADNPPAHARCQENRLEETVELAATASTTERRIAMNR